MNGSASRGAIEAAVRRTIEQNPCKVQEWIVDRPGSWGFLAGKAVVDCRQTLGRGLTDRERREVWDRLWQCLEELRR